jgi:hypothetical protein
MPEARSFLKFGLFQILPHFLAFQDGCSTWLKVLFSASEFLLTFSNQPLTLQSTFGTLVISYFDPVTKHLTAESASSFLGAARC